MNSLRRVSAGLICLAWWVAGMGMLAPWAVHADESRLPFPASPSAARSGDGAANGRGAAQVSPPAQQQPFRFDDRPIDHPTHHPSHRPLRAVASSLAIVLGGFALFLVCFRRQPSARCSGAMDTLGTIQVAPRVRLHLVRLGGRILLLHLTPGKIERVAEITDPGEVENLLAAHHGVPRQPGGNQSRVSTGSDRLHVQGIGTAGSSE